MTREIKPVRTFPPKAQQHVYELSEEQTKEAIKAWLIEAGAPVQTVEQITIEKIGEPRRHIFSILVTCKE